MSGSYDHTLKKWRLSTGECLATLRGHLAAVLSVQFDCSKIVSGSCDNTIKVCYHRFCLNVRGACAYYLKTLLCFMFVWDMKDFWCVSTELHKNVFTELQKSFENKFTNNK